jgi:hypothetical protein
MAGNVLYMGLIDMGIAAVSNPYLVFPLTA